MVKKTEKILGGIITLLILKTLLEEPKHGYELEKIIREKLDYKLPEGSIYVILKNLERRGLIKPQVMKNERGHDIKKYIITEEGKKFFLSHEKPLIAVRKVLDEIIADIQKLKIR
ncbi:PadR family transcriptional regulator [Saccharolobus solfataricus]|uniref:PadR family transcriptional regulator n=2 Tax=Saccharolobus solfataricus TaxID=2287 RepID=A0A0E3MGR4_SACSO|nr:PadR family transcriptional regulator [Saccharolobus solfataricus]AKA74217.1 PadR family transcriptional regulator [Saccharolobus solfataricus]AKA76915.1 PadR family transcriptional regulator [Saccharolobus solfataricus]AKA79607.1 PadR family transcriptional regulator [Saccharolobus solfataricus]AZF68698.1 PadR family transcriptional regulator [Saccharolobus solfataricus]AZF71318.1 PadR family transcriptional regulator [Saccharolobus solfataricus]